MKIQKWMQVFLLFGVSMVLLGAPAQSARYGPGVTDKEIKIGNINPYSGPAAAYGTIGRTISAYFKMLNETQGGINGRKINFISYDDGYSPPKTIEMARRLVERDKVLFIFQSLGTPTNTAIHRYMNKKKTPHLFVATGAGKWNNPSKFPWTMGWQPNYVTEAKIYAKYIAQNVPNARIGILYQNDDYGKDYLHGFRAGIKNVPGAKIVIEQSYEVTSPTIDSQMVNLKNSGANVFLNVTTPKFAAQSIKKAAALGWNPVHFLNNVAISVARVLKPAGFMNSDKIISTTYGKDPDDPEWANDPEIKEWRAFMKKWYPGGSLHSTFNVYGYGVAKTLEHVLRKTGDNLTREDIMRSAASIKDLKVPTILPGILLNTSATDFAPIEQMQLMRFDGKKGSWIRFGEILGAD